MIAVSFVSLNAFVIHSAFDTALCYYTAVLQDWRLMTDLLLVDKSAPDLSSEQQTILLRLLVASVCKLVGSCVNRGASAAAKRESEQLQVRGVFLL